MTYENTGSSSNMGSSPESRSAGLVVGSRDTAGSTTICLLRLGPQRIAFVAKPLSMSTITGRIAGYREALFAHGVGVQEDLVRRGESEDTRFLNHVLDACRPEAIVCANDATAAKVMSHLSSNGVRVPEEMRARYEVCVHAANAAHEAASKLRQHRATVISGGRVAWDVRV